MQSLSKIHSFDEVFDSQKLFRQILTAMSNPIKLVSIKEFSDKLYGENPEMLALAMTLLDNEVSFSAYENKSLTDEISFLTLAKKEALQKADYIFVTDASMLETVMKSAKCGTLRDPHKSATIIVKNADRGRHTLQLYGPGIKGSVKFQTSEVVKTAMDLRDAQFYEYPQGVDFIFISDKGELFSLPRLVFREAL
jgi:alpha-D-ribose 1-methylphosphonate 5-triphosphate synthase subunit PhnH